jgi:hypothetical protein
MKNIIIISLVTILIAVLFIYLLGANKKNNKLINKSSDTNNKNYNIVITPYMKKFFLDYVTNKTINKYEQDEKIKDIYVCLFYLLNENYGNDVLENLNNKLKDNPRMKYEESPVKYYTWSKYDNIRRLFINSINNKIVFPKRYLTNDFNRNYEIICDIFDDVTKECKIIIK